MWTPDELSVLVHSTTWTLLVISTILLGLRLWTRLRTNCVGCQPDDWVLLAGWIFVFLASGCMSWLMMEFLVPGSLTKITLARVHQNLQSIALGLTKTSFAMTLLRLFLKGWERYLIWVLVVSMNAQFLAHIIATWQPVCGTPDQGHLDVKCWTLEGTVTFAVFCASYSAACDFILALLPWKMIFNLQMKTSERVGVAVALSMGIVAGIMGIMKAYQNSLLDNINDPSMILYNQAVNWIWSMAEPNVTIMSASIPVLRGFVRSVAKGTSTSYQAAGAYVRTGDKSSNLYGKSSSRTRPEADDADGESDTSILRQSDGVSMRRAISRKTEVNIEYSFKDDEVMNRAKPTANMAVAGIEMDDMGFGMSRRSGL